MSPLATYHEPATREERSQYRAAAKQLAEIPDSMLACRDGNHSFVIPIDGGRTRGGYWRERKCRNKCGCTQSQVLTTMGLILKSNINYPKGYLLKGVGRGRYTKGAARVEALERLLSNQAAAS